MSNRKKKEVIRKQEEKRQKIKKALIRIVVILLAVAIIVGIYFLNKEEPTAPPTIGTIVNREATDITGVAISTGEISYSLRFNELLGMYIVEGYESELLDHFSAAAAIVYSVDDISYTEKIEDVKDLAEYGLADTKKSILVTYADGTEFKLLMGDKCGDFEYYVMKENDSVVYKMLATDYEHLMVHPKEYRIMDICEIDPTTVTDLVVKKNGKTEVEIAVNDNYQQTNEYQTASYLVKYPYDNLNASLGMLTYVLDEVTDLNALEIVEENATDLAKYGLTEDKAIVLKVTNPEETIELILGDKKDDKVYLKRSDSDVVYLVSDALYELLNENRAINYVEDFIGIYNIEDVSSVELVKGKEKHTMKMSKDSKGNSAFTIDGESVEDKAFRKLYQYVIGLTLEDIVDKEPGGKVYMTVKYTFKDSTSVQYTYYDYDKEFCIVKGSNGCSCLTLKEELDTAFEKIAEGE